MSRKMFLKKWKIFSFFKPILCTNQKNYLSTVPLLCSTNLKKFMIRHQIFTSLPIYLH